MTLTDRREWTRLAGFGWVFSLLAAAGILQVVILVRVVGSRAWSEVALAQSAAALTTAVAALGWSTVGASVIALYPPPERVRLFAQSLVVRGYAFVICAPLLVFVMTRLASVNPAAASLLAFAGLIPVLGASWYFIGQGSPARLMVRDTLPQVTGMLAGLPLAATFGLTAYAGAVLAGNVAAVALGIDGVRRDGQFGLVAQDRTFRAAGTFVRDHQEALVASWTGSINSYLPTLVVARLAGIGLPPFALADRLLRYALGAFSPVVQFVQGWVPRQPGEIGKRARLALVWAAFIGLGAAVVIVSAGRPVSRALSGGAIVLDADLLVPFALAVGTLMVGQVTALAVLVPLGMTRALASSTAAGTALLLVGVVPAAITSGARGVAWSMAACEAVAVTWQVVVVVKATRRGAS